MIMEEVDLFLRWRIDQVITVACQDVNIQGVGELLGR
jgi:hypothetical protein